MSVRYFFSVAADEEILRKQAELKANDGEHKKKKEFNSIEKLEKENKMKKEKQ